MVDDIQFAYNYNTGYFDQLIFKKVKRGEPFGSNYICIEQGEFYRISKY